MSFPNIVKSAFHDIELIEYGIDEPNNGRMLNVVDLKINGELVTDRYFSKGWNYTLICKPYQPDSPDGRFFFLPTESGVLLDTANNFAVIGLRSTILAASNIIGNTYFNNHLFVVYRNEVAVMHLHTFEQTIYHFDKIRVVWVKPIDDNQFELSYKENNLYTDATKFRTIRFA